MKSFVCHKWSMEPPLKQIIWVRVSVGLNRVNRKHSLARSFPCPAPPNTGMVSAIPTRRLDAQSMNPWCSYRLLLWSDPVNLLWIPMVATLPLRPTSWSGGTSDEFTAGVAGLPGEVNFCGGPGEFLRFLLKNRSIGVIIKKPTIRLTTPPGPR